MKALYPTQEGAIVGESLANKFGWKIGDMIPLQATIFPTKGSNNWNFKLVAIYRVNDNKRKGEENTLMFNWKYFDEANDYIKGQVHWYVIDVANSDQSN